MATGQLNAWMVQRQCHARLQSLITVLSCALTAVRHGQAIATAQGLQEAQLRAVAPMPNLITTSDAWQGVCGAVAVSDHTGTHRANPYSWAGPALKQGEPCLLSAQ